ncbi:MAG TPA: hypothetical protein VLH77_07305 [Gammaproteobacteria bacterium]|nr:hypothetical protein [Gammaproteobacteria bacterium]
MKKKLLFLFVFLQYTPQQLHAMPEISDQVKIGAAALGIAASSYLIGRSSAHLLYNKAYKRYDTARAIIAGYEYEEPALRAYLKQEIMVDNEAHFDKTSPYRNYPLVYYKNNLDWYIRWLNHLRLFVYGSALKTNLLQLLDDLQRIRRYVVTDPAFIFERRQADELEENRNHVPEVIIHHRD